MDATHPQGRHRRGGAGKQNGSRRRAAPSGGKGSSTRARPSNPGKKKAAWPPSAGDPGRYLRGGPQVEEPLWFVNKNGIKRRHPAGELLPSLPKPQLPARRGGGRGEDNGGGGSSTMPSFAEVAGGSAPLGGPPARGRRGGRGGGKRGAASASSTSSSSGPDELEEAAPRAGVYRLTLAVGGAGGVRRGGSAAAARAAAQGVDGGGNESSSGEGGEGGEQSASVVSAEAGPKDETVYFGTSWDLEAAEKTSRETLEEGSHPCVALQSRFRRARRAQQRTCGAAPYLQRAQSADSSPASQQSGGKTEKRGGEQGDERGGKGRSEGRGEGALNRDDGGARAAVDDAKLSAARRPRLRGSVQGTGMRWQSDELLAFLGEKGMVHGVDGSYTNQLETEGRSFKEEGVHSPAAGVFEAAARFGGLGGRGVTTGGRPLSLESERGADVGDEVWPHGSSLGGNGSHDTPAFGSAAEIAQTAAAADSAAVGAVAHIQLTFEVVEVVEDRGTRDKGDKERLDFGAFEDKLRHRLRVHEDTYKKETLRRLVLQQVRSLVLHVIKL